jgi:hypothetical protein
MNWISTNPEVPEEAWCKDFGAFKLVGRGASPGTLLQEINPVSARASDFRQTQQRLGKRYTGLSLP